MNSPAAPIRPTGFLIGADGKVRPIWRALLYALASAVAIFAVILVIGILVEAISPGTMRRETGAALMMAHPGLFILIYAASNVALSLLAWLFLATFDRCSFRALGLWLYPGWGREVLTGMGLGVGILLVGVAFSVALHAIGFSGAAEISSRTLLGLLKVAALLLFAAANEELLFRGYAFQRLAASVGALWAVLITSALFGAGHLLNPSATPLSTANTVLAGVLLSLAYLKTRALWLPIGLHWAWNFTMGPILGLPVSGLNISPTLFRSEAAGPTWLAGGVYGPEGGLILTLVCLAATLWLARSRKIAPSPAMKEVLK